MLNAHLFYHVRVDAASPPLRFGQNLEVTWANTELPLRLESVSLVLQAQEGGEGEGKGE